MISLYDFSKIVILPETVGLAEVTSISDSVKWNKPSCKNFKDL